MKCVWRVLFGMAWVLLVRAAFAAPCPAPASGSAIDTPGSPFGIAVTPDGCWMFVSMEQGKGDGTLAVLHDAGGTYSIDRGIHLSGMGLGETLSHDGRLLVVATWTGVAVFDVARLEHPTGDPLVGQLPTGEGTGAVYVITSRGDRLLFVSEEDAGTIAVYDLAAWRAAGFKGRALVGSIPAAQAPVGLALSPDGQWLYATVQEASPRDGLARNCQPRARIDRWHSEGFLLRINVAKAATQPRRSVSGIVPAGCNPVRVAVSPNGAYVWVTERDSGMLLQVPASVFADAASKANAETVHVRGEPVGIVVRPDGHQVWATLSDRFASARGATDPGRQLVGLLGAGNGPAGSARLASGAASGFPRELTFLPDGRTLAVGLFRAKRIEFIATPP